MIDITISPTIPPISTMIRGSASASSAAEPGFELRVEKIRGPVHHARKHRGRPLRW
jgi:acetoin utilization deacetylase AcuC-like enzyme